MAVTSTGNAKSVQPKRAKIRSTDGLSTADLSIVPVSYDVVLEELARKSLAPKENSNKNTFYAVSQSRSSSEKKTKMSITTETLIPQTST